MAKDMTKKHKDYGKWAARWREINDICDGENLRTYLVPLNPSDTSKENQDRNDQYFRRAVFYGIGGYTSRGMVGMLYKKWPTLTVPTGLEYTKFNADGAGLSIYQQSQSLARDLVRLGRSGIWVDYPDVGDVASVADMQQGRIFAVCRQFSPVDILDWQEEQIGARVRISRVVLADTILDDEGEEIEVRIELFMDGNAYTVREWQQSNAGWEITREAVPRDASGSTWDEIPFLFAGAEANNPNIDQPPMRDIVRINIGHFNNSASYEDSIFFAGQVQPWMSGISEDYIELLNKNNMYVGSGRLLGVPSGETFGFAQAQPNQALKEAMLDKVDMAIGLGAMFIQPGSAAKTATQIAGEQQISHSILSLIASNVSEAYTQALKWMARYMGAPEDNLVYEVTQDFVDPVATPQELQAIVASMLQGAVPFSDFVSWSQRHGYIDPEKTPDQVAEEVGRGSPMPDLGGADNAQNA